MAIPPFVTTPIAGVIPFDNSTNGFEAQDVQSAIEEALSGESDDNFSHRVISLDQKVLVKSGQQMFLSGALILEGTLSVDGQIVVDDFESVDGFSYKEIESDKTVKIPQSRQMIVDGNLLVEGILLVEGELSIINDSDTDSGLTPYFIKTGRRYNIRSGEEFFLATDLRNEGTMINEGRLVVGG